MDDARPPKIVARLEPDVSATQLVSIGRGAVVLLARKEALALLDELLARFSVNFPSSRIPSHRAVAIIPLAAALLSHSRDVSRTGWRGGGDRGPTPATNMYSSGVPIMSDAEPRASRPFLEQMGGR